MTPSYQVTKYHDSIRCSLALTSLLAVMAVCFMFFSFCRYVYSHCAMKAWSCQTTSRHLVISVQFSLPTHSVLRQLPEKSADMLRISMINK